MMEAGIAQVGPNARASISRATAWTGAIALLLLVAIAFLHTKAGRPLLAKLGVGCPIGKASAEEIDRARAIAAAAYLGKPTTLVRPALGFELEKTTPDDVEAWARRHEIRCEKLRGNETLRACKDVPASALGEAESFARAEEVDFEFRSGGTLAVVTAIRRGLSLPQAHAMTADISSYLGKQLGAPTKTSGENTLAHFAKGPLQAYQEAYEFGNYAATLTETRIGELGVLLREHYFSPLP